MSQFIGQGRPGTAIDQALIVEALTRHILPQQINQVLSQTGRVEERCRKLPAAAVVWLVIMMALRRDLDQRSAWRQVAGMYACLLAPKTCPVKSALSKARARLGARPMRQLLRLTASVATAATASSPSCGACYQGMRMLAMDGDDYKVPDTPANAKAFGRPLTRRGEEQLPGGYPQLHLCRLIEVGTRITLEAIIKPCHSTDHQAAPALLAATRSGDLILWDKGFYSHRLLADAHRQGRHFLGPVPSHVVLKPVAQLPDGSYLAKIYASANDRRDDRDGLLLRVMHYTLDEPTRTGQSHRLITDLLDAGLYPGLELIVLYHQRWEIEIANDEITTHQLDQPVELRSKLPCGVVQELYGVLVAHNALRSVMREAAAGIEVDPRTLSFMDSVRIIRETLGLMRNARTTQLPVLYDAMIRAIARCVLPPRDGRINPRVVKVIRPSNFPAKRPWHLKPPRPSKTFVESIVMLK